MQERGSRELWRKTWPVGRGTKTGAASVTPCVHGGNTVRGYVHSYHEGELDMNRSFAVVLLCLWMGMLAALATLYANQGFVSVAQLRAAEEVVEARIETADRSSLAVTVAVLHVYRGKLRQGQEIRVIGLEESALDALEPGQVWIFPLTRADEAYQVTRYPLRSPSRIYRATPGVRHQVEWSLQLR